MSGRGRKVKDDYFNTANGFVSAEYTMPLPDLNSQIDQIREAFPDISKENAAIVLQSCDCSLEKAIYSITQDGGEDILGSWNFQGKKGRNNFTASKSKKKKKSNKKNKNHNHAQTPDGTTSILNGKIEEKSIDTGLEAQAIETDQSTPTIASETTAQAAESICSSRKSSISMLSECPSLPQTPLPQTSDNKMTFPNHTKTNKATEASKKKATVIDAMPRSAKDLQRSAVAIARFHLVHVEQCENAEKAIKQCFKRIKESVAEKERTLMEELIKVKDEAGTLLDDRQQLAASLKFRCERIGCMTEHEISELRAEIKHFVKDRNIDEDVAKTNRFVADCDELIQAIENFGHIVPLKADYRPRSTSLAAKRPAEDVLQVALTEKVIEPVRTQAEATIKSPEKSQDEPRITNKTMSFSELKELAETHTKLKEALHQQGLVEDKITKKDDYIKGRLNNLPSHKDKNDNKSVPARAPKVTEEKASVSRHDQKQEENTKIDNRANQGNQMPPKHWHSDDDKKDRGYRGQERSGRGRFDRNKADRGGFERNRSDRNRPHQERFHDNRLGSDRTGQNRHNQTQHPTQTQQQGQVQQPDKNRPKKDQQSNESRPDPIRQPVQTQPSQAQPKQTQHQGQTQRQGESQRSDRNRADKPLRPDQARPDPSRRPYQNQPNQTQQQGQTRRPDRNRPDRTQRPDQTRVDMARQTNQSHSNQIQIDQNHMHQDGNVSKTEVTTQNNHNDKGLQEKPAQIRMDSFGPVKDEKLQPESLHENRSGQRRRNFSPKRKPVDISNEKGGDEDNKRSSRKARRIRKRREGGPNNREAGARGRNDSTSDGDSNWRGSVREETPRDADLRGADVKKVSSIVVNKEPSGVVDGQKNEKSQIASGNDSKVERSEKIEKNEIIVTIDASSEGHRTVSEKKPTTNFTQHEGLPQRQRNNRRNRNKSWYEKVEEDNNTQVRNGHVDYRRGNRRVSNVKDKDSQIKENTPQSKLVTGDASVGGKNQVNGHSSENSADRKVEVNTQKPEVNTQKPEVNTKSVDIARSMNSPPRPKEKQTITCNGHDQINVVSERNGKPDKEMKREEKSSNVVKDVNGNY